MLEYLVKSLNGLQFEPSRVDSERRLSEWIETAEASNAVPDLVSFLRDEPNALDGFMFIATGSHDLGLEYELLHPNNNSALPGLQQACIAEVGPACATPHLR